MKKTVVVLSGGLDSSVLAAALKHEGRELKAISVNYGQRHNRELVAARDVCDYLAIEHRICDLSDLRQFMSGSSQTDARVAVPHGHYAAENMKLTVVPNRNMILLAVAGAWAISTKSDSIAYAAHGGDHAIYPDCRETFVAPFAEALRNADWHPVEVERPFLGKTKAEIVDIGNELHFPMGRTYSCYEGGAVHCGRCGTCAERAGAFAAAGVPDPTEYLDPDFYKTVAA